MPFKHITHILVQGIILKFVGFTLLKPKSDIDVYWEYLIRNMFLWSTFLYIKNQENKFKESDNFVLQYVNLQCCPVLVPHIIGMGGPPETINLSLWQT